MKRIEKTMKRGVLIAAVVSIPSACTKRTGDLMVLGKAPSFRFTNQEGKTITDHFYDDKVYVTEFFFTSCPTICPILNRHMVTLQNKFTGNAEFGIASFTVDPKTDTPEVLHRYAKNLGATSENWNFLTGAPEAIYDLAVKGYFVSAQPDTAAPGGFFHTQYFMLVDKKGNIRVPRDAHGNPVFYDGTKPKDITRLERDIQTLLDA